jgi:hypothetical protein
MKKIRKTIRMTGVSADIRTEHFPDTSAMADLRSAPPPRGIC